MGRRRDYRPNGGEDLESRVVPSFVAPAIAHIKRTHPVVHRPAVHRPKPVHRPQPKLPKWYRPITSPSPVLTVATPPPPRPPVVATPPTQTPPPLPAPVAPTQTLSVASLSADQFTSLFQPLGTAPVMASSFETGVETLGVFESQVFEGIGAAAGLYAYAYQVQVQSGADGVVTVSIPFDDTPVGRHLADDALSYGYLVADGAAGKLTVPRGDAGPPEAASLSWRAGTHGLLTLAFATPLGNGDISATIVVLADRPPSQQFVTFAGTNSSQAADVLTSAYSPQPGAIVVLPST